MVTLSNNNPLYAYRRVKNLAAQALAVAATVFGLFWLVWIVWTTLTKGLASINMDLFTQMTPPPGETGGMLNAFFGSAVMSLLGIALGAVGYISAASAMVSARSAPPPRSSRPSPSRPAPA